MKEQGFGYGTTPTSKNPNQRGKATSKNNTPARSPSSKPSLDLLKHFLRIGGFKYYFYIILF